MKNEKPIVIMYDTCGVLANYWKTNSLYLPEYLLPEGEKVDVITEGVLSELNSLGSGKGCTKIPTYNVLNQIYSYWSKGKIIISESKIEEGLRKRLPHILKNVSINNNQRVGRGEESIIASSINEFKRHEIKIVTMDSDIPNLIKGLSLRDRIEVIDPTI